MTDPDPKRYNFPDRPTLDAVDVGAVGAALLALTRELWVLTDRVVVFEAVLAKHGIDVSAEIDAWQPDASMKAKLDAAGQRLVANVVNVLAGLTEP